VPRRVGGGVFYRTASTALGRLACEYADPAGLNHPHDHAVCLHDDAAYAADLLLHLAAALVSGDDDTVLDRITDTRDALDKDRW